MDSSCVYVPDNLPPAYSPFSKNSKNPDKYIRMMKQYIPILEWLPNYQRNWLRGDFLAGITVGVMLIPQGMAYGLLAGLPPVYGLYASIVPLFIYAIFGTSRQLSVGPVALVSLLVIAGISQQGAAVGSDTFILLAISTALVAGLIQLLLGVARLGSLVNFLSHPVIAGFTSAAAFIIGISQIKYLLGLDIKGGSSFMTMVRDIAVNINQIHWPTLLIGVGSTLLILYLRKLNKLYPAGLVAIVLTTLLVWIAGLDSKGVAILGNVPSGLPDFRWPDMSSATIAKLLPLSVTICIISFIESLAIAKTLESRHKNYRINPNQELIALGLAKIAGAFFQAFPTTGSFTRSAVNDDAGAQSGLASIISGLFICIVLLVLTPLFYYLPQAVLAAVILAAVFALVDYETAIHLWKTDRRDWLAMMVTFAATLLFGIQNGVLSGVILSLGLMIYRNAKPHVAVLGQLPDSTHYRNIDRFEEAIQCDEILIVRFDAQLYFGNAVYFRETLENLVNQESDQLRVVILDASGIHDIDSSGIHELSETIYFLQDRNIALYLAGTIGPVRDILQKNHLLEKIGIDHHYLDVHSAVEGFRKGGMAAAVNTTAAIQTNVRP